jgi:hypothetical protein
MVKLLMRHFPTARNNGGNIRIFCMSIIPPTASDIMIIDAHDINKYMHH